MTQRSDYLLQVFEKIGAPLLAAVMELSVRNPQTDISGEAEQMASLLGKSTQMSLSLSGLIDMPDNPEEADPVRLALAALCAQLVANQYRISNRIPEEADIEKIKTALQAVMTYSDNFSGAVDSTNRLKALDSDFIPRDKTQIHACYIHTLIPAVNSVMAFPFGQKEQKLIQDVCDKLIDRTKQMCEQIFPELSDGDQTQMELSLLKSIVMVYSQCHFAEMAKLMAVPEQDREAALSMEPLWTAFENRIAMLEMVSLHLVPGEEEKPEEKEVPNVVQKEDSPPQAPSENNESSGPMTFFTKKEETGETT